MDDSKRLLKIAISAAINRVGKSAWQLLGKPLREALIAREVCVLIAMNGRNPGWESAAALVDLMHATSEER